MVKESSRQLRLFKTRGAFTAKKATARVGQACGAVKIAAQAMGRIVPLRDAN